MPTRARLDEFIAVVVSGDHAGAIERYYTEDASMQENAATPRVGRDGLVAHERAVLARMATVISKCISSTLEGDRVAIHWNFVLTENRRREASAKGIWTAPPGFRWVSVGHGMWQLAPISGPNADRNPVSCG